MIALKMIYTTGVYCKWFCNQNASKVRKKIKEPSSYIFYMKKMSFTKLSSAYET